MDHIVRELKEAEYPVLKDFLYEAIFIPPGVKKPPKSIVDLPELRIYIDNFGKQRGDGALCAEVKGKIVGAVWMRIMDDYGHVDDETPSLAISLFEEYRGQGIGTALLYKMLEFAKAKGFKQLSLSVQKSNYALALYKKAGFEILEDKDEEYIMIKNLED